MPRSLTETRRFLAMHANNGTNFDETAESELFLDWIALVYSLIWLVDTPRMQTPFKSAATFFAAATLP